MSGGLLEVVRSNFRQKNFPTFYLLKKCLGGSRRVLGVPRTLLKIMNVSGKYSFFKHICLLPIVLPIVLPIGTCYPVLFNLVAFPTWRFSENMRSNSLQGAAHTCELLDIVFSEKRQVGKPLGWTGNTMGNTIGNTIGNKKTCSNNQISG